MIRSDSLASASVSRAGWLPTHASGGRVGGEPVALGSAAVDVTAWLPTQGAAA